MIMTVDYKHIQSIINERCPNSPVTESEAAEAFHNLVDFVNLLIEINNEQNLVPDNPKR
jgi:hypothetical protein